MILSIYVIESIVRQNDLLLYNFAASNSGVKGIYFVLKLRVQFLECEIINCWKKEYI